MNKNIINGTIKSIPKKWDEEEIELMWNLKQKGYSISKIANKLNRTETSVNIKLKRVNKKNDNYNPEHRKEKYAMNKLFIRNISPSSILDVYAGNSFYKNSVFCNEIKVIDNDKDSKYKCDYNLNSIDFLHEFKNKKFDLVDLDPYGSAFECFDYALQIAQKGLIITFGEVGHKRWKRSDFVKHRYDIKSLKEFTDNKFVDYIIKRGLIFNKKITVKHIGNFRNILRVYFLVETITKSVSGKEYFTAPVFKKISEW